MSERVKPFYECVHCGKKLTTEDRLAKHNCEMKKRHDFLKTTKGKAAYYCYLKWFELQGRTIKDISVFQSSRFYNNIIDFVKFCNQVGIPDRTDYIKFMIGKGLMPGMWTKPDVYEEYIKYFDDHKSPEELAQITMDTIFDLAQIFECETREVFEHMSSADIMRLVVARKLSPWILLFSPGFMVHLRTSTTAEQKIMIESVVDHKVWAEKFKQHPESVKMMMRIVQEFKL